MERKSTVVLGSSPSPMARGKLGREVKLWTNRGWNVVCHDLTCPVQGGWAVQELQGVCGVFWGEEAGKLRRYCFDRQGVRKTALPQEMESGGVEGKAEYRTLSPRRWAEETARMARFGLRLRRRTVAVEGEYPLRQGLEQVLRAAGCRLEPRWRPGIPAFGMEQGGFLLTARDERGAVVDSGQLLAVLTLIEMEQGGGVVALPPWTSVSAKLVAAGFRGRVLELDRDGKWGWERYAALPWLREAPSGAARILARMACSGQSLESLVAKTPRFQVWKREIPLHWERERVLKRLEEQGKIQPEGDGFQLHVGQAWLHVRPLNDWRVQVMAEGPDLEAAEELCDLCLRRLGRE